MDAEAKFNGDHFHGDGEQWPLNRRKTRLIPAFKWCEANVGRGQFPFLLQ